MSFNRDYIMKYPYESRLESPGGTSDSEDPLSSSVYDNHLCAKTPIKGRPSQRDILLSPSPISPPKGCPVWSAVSPSPSSSCNIENMPLPKWQDRESPFSIKLESSSSIDLHQIAEIVEPAAPVALRPRKRYTKYPRPKKTRKNRGLYHMEVPVPDPVYYSFKCEWKGCQAELMNMEILRKHVCVAHGKILPDGGRRCLWRKCGEAWEDMHAESESLDSDVTIKNRQLRVIYRTKREWKEHVEDCHMIPFSWHMGDGPRGTRLGMKYLRKSNTFFHFTEELT